jgi:hypothetical protein
MTKEQSTSIRNLWYKSIKNGEREEQLSLDERQKTRPLRDINKISTRYQQGITQLYCLYPDKN